MLLNPISWCFLSGTDPESLNGAEMGRDPDCWLSCGKRKGERITHKPTAFVKSSHGTNDCGDVAVLMMKNMVLIVTRNGTRSFLDQKNPFIKASEVSKSVTAGSPWC